MEIKITYLDNSGFLAETQNFNFIFDYYNGRAAKGGCGVIYPEMLRGKATYVFISHAHYDHYNPDIFNRLSDVADITYIVSCDVRTKRNVYRVSANKTYNIKAIEVETFKSTDEGSAFLVKADGARIYHAGDLNWWDWVGEPKDWLKAMERDYKAQISKLAHKHINIAFVPVDPRLEKNMGKGAEFLIKTADVDLLIPMHYRAATSRARDFILKNFSSRQKTTVELPLNRGEEIVYKTEGDRFTVNRLQY